MARLTDAQWAAIRAEWRTGAFSNVELAKKYGITEKAIRKRAITEGWIRDLGDAAEARAARKMIDRENPGSEGSEDGSDQGGQSDPYRTRKSEEAIRKAGLLRLAEESVLEQLADQRATANLAALARAQDLTAVRNRYLGLIQDVMSGDQEKVALAGPVLLMGRGDSLSGAIKALAAVDESLQKVIRTALGMDREAKRVQISGPGGGPMQTEAKASFDVSKLTTEQLVALSQVNAMLDGADIDRPPPRPPGEPD